MWILFTLFAFYIFDGATGQDNKFVKMPLSMDINNNTYYCVLSVGG